MSDIFQEVFDWLSDAIGSLLSTVFNFIFDACLSSISDYGKSILKFVSNQAPNFESFLSSNLFYICLGLPVFVLLFKIIIRVVRG